MCKHVAAVLYGVGVRLDERPELLFTLRRVDAKDLVARAGAGLPRPKVGPAAGKVLDKSLLGEVFGIDMAEVSVPAVRSKRTTARKKPTLRVELPAPKNPAGKRTTAVGALTRGAAAMKRRQGVGKS